MRAPRLSPRWLKVLRDLQHEPTRALLAVLAMAAGALGLSTILCAYAVLTRELAVTYRETRPAAAILTLDRVDDASVEIARRVSGVSEAEARPMLIGRARVGPDEWATLVLYVVRDWSHVGVDVIVPDSGTWPPEDNDVLLERTAISVARTPVGGTLAMRLGDSERSARVAGTVHAAGLAPAWMDYVVSGFVGWKSPLRAAATSERAQLRLVLSQSDLDRAGIRAVADQVRVALEARGRTVSRIDVPAPGRHPHADQMDTFLFLLGAFGALTSVLSAVLVANMIHTVLSEQVRQVGVMKTIGATRRQIAALYLVQVSILGVFALSAGVPLGFTAGRAYARFAATMLNMSMASDAVPVWVGAVLLAAGLGIPLLVALGPLLSASNVSVHQALSGRSNLAAFGSRAFERGLAAIRFLPRPLMLSLRTLFRRRARLALTVGTLAAGGAVFISAMNVAAAWTRAVDNDAKARPYDVAVELSDRYSVDQVSRALRNVPGIVRTESWNQVPATRRDSTGNEMRVNLVAPDSQGALNLGVLAGRWIGANDEPGVVINQVLLAQDPTLQIGGPIVLGVEGRIVSWPIVGVVKELASPPSVYARGRDVLAALGQPAAVTNNLWVVTGTHDTQAQLSAAQELESALRREGIGVANVVRLGDRRKAVEDHLIIVFSALIFAAALVVLVGGLGLMSSLSLNVLERTRELGILSALGARPRVISFYIVVEGLMVGAMSFGVAALLALPVTCILDSVAGRTFLRTPLDPVFSASAAGAWLLLLSVLSAVSSLYPAWRAGRLAVREALAHE